MKKIIYLVIVFLLFYCNENKSIDDQVEPIRYKSEFGVFTFIFDKSPNPLFITLSEDENLGGRTYFNEIASYRDIEGIEHFLRPNRNDRDTLSVFSKEHSIEFYFYTKGFEGHTYLFKNGDTIQVNYKDGMPVIHVLNRPTKHYDYLFARQSKYNLIFENIFRKIPMPPKEILNDKEKRNSFYEDYLDSNISLLKIELETEKEILDSLYIKELISQDVYEYNKTKLKFIEYSASAKTKKLKIYNDTIQSNTNPDIKTDQNIFLNGSTISANDIIKRGDTLLKYKYFHDFISNTFLPNYFEQQTKSSYQYNNFGKYYSRWDIVYDSIEGSHIFPKNVKEYLLLQYMGRIVEDLEPKTIDAYTKKFFETVENKNYKDLFKSEYQLKESDSYKLELYDETKNVEFLEDIIKDNSGKVIFLNFWASWCGPCIKSLPKLNELKKEYVNEVVFIDISTENKFDEWLSSKTFSSMNKTPYNFLIINPYLSNFLKENHVDFIPRYMLIDKNGNLVHDDIQDISGEEIKQLLKKYLKK